MADLRAQYKQAFSAIHEILIREWDPIGIGHFAEAQDEYDMYIPIIWSLLVDGSTDAVIAEHLGKIEAERMELPERPEHNFQIAQRLRSAVPRG